MVVNTEEYKKYVKERLVEERKERLISTKARVGRFVRGTEKTLSKIKLPQSRPRISREKSRRVGRAVTGILGALVPQEAMAGAVTYTKKGEKGDRGRGRPHGTYKTRYVPGYGQVNVPTHKSSYSCFCRN